MGDLRLSLQRLKLKIKLSDGFSAESSRRYGKEAARPYGKSFARRYGELVACTPSAVSDRT
jgi:hypothetical protein